MIELCEKLYFYKPKDGFILNNINPYSGEKTTEAFIALKNDKSDEGKLLKLEKADFKSLFDEALLINTLDDLLRLYNKYGHYINDLKYYINNDFSDYELKKIPTYIYSDILDTKEAIDLIALLESNDRKELGKLFRWRLKNSYFKRQYGSCGVFGFIELPQNELSEIDNIKAAEYIINSLISTRHNLQVYCQYKRNGSRQFFVPDSLTSFLNLYLTDSLMAGSKYKICESCGKSFLVEIKPGREPLTCHPNCRQRKHRSKAK